MQIDIIEIGTCICGKQVIAITNPFARTMKKLFTDYQHIDSTPLCA